jgi:hypothetical protein
MSQTIRDALRPSIDQKTADFVDASIAVQNADRVRDETAILNRLVRLQDELSTVKNQIAEINALIASQPDDKYALTKAKLIRLMKQQGIYDE